MAVYIDFCQDCRKTNPLIRSQNLWEVDGDSVDYLIYIHPCVLIGSLITICSFLYSDWLTGTPHAITWGVEARLCMVRVLARGAGGATYFENRLPGAAMNSYLGLGNISDTFIRTLLRLFLLFEWQYLSSSLDALGVQKNGGRRFR